MLLAVASGTALHLASHHCRSQSLIWTGAQLTSSRSRQTSGIRFGRLKPIKSSVVPPPADYDFRADCQDSTAAYIAQHHPELTDLVEEGSLIVIQRPALYTERRTDGYQEPEVVYILGTAHLSSKSGEDSRRLVEAVLPDNVVVELCKTRAGVMYTPDAASSDKGAFQAGGGSFSEVVTNMLARGGPSALVLRLLLARATRGLGNELGVEAGQEFKAARQAAEGCHAQIVLGDRPIEVSLQRAWDALSWRRRLQLLSGLAQASVTKPDFDESVIEQMKSDTAVSAMLKEFSTQFPEVIAPLIHERDVYLAWSLTRSKAVNGSRRVVGVVGRGHLPGIVHACTHHHGKLRFRDLAGTRRSKQQFKDGVLRRLAFELALLAATVLLWQRFTEGSV